MDTEQDLYRAQTALEKFERDLLAPDVSVVSAANMEHWKLKGTMAESSAKSIALNNFFAHLPARRAMMLQALSRMANTAGSDEALKAELQKIAQARNNPNEARLLLDRLKYGISDRQRDAFIKAMIAIDGAIDTVSEFARTRARESVPAYAALEVSVEGLRASAAYADDIQALREELAPLVTGAYTMDDALRDAEMIANGQPPIGNVSPNITNMIIRITEKNGPELFKAFRTQEHHEELMRRHKEATTISKAMVGAMFVERSASGNDEYWNASDVIARRGVTGNNKEQRTAFHKKFDACAASLGLKAKLSAADLSAIRKEAEDHLIGSTCKLKSVIDSIDETHELKIEKGVPPGQREEEIFNRMFEDAMYNAIMKRNGGLEAYANLTGSDPAAGLVKIEDNYYGGHYSSPLENGSQYADVTKKAFELDTLQVAMNDFYANRITEGQLKQQINQVDFLGADEKRGFFEACTNTKKASPKITADMFGDRGGKSFKDELNSFEHALEGRNLHNDIFGGEVRQFIGEYLGVTTKAQRNFEACLDSADNPTTTHHTPGHGVEECINKFIQDEKRAGEELGQALANPALAIGGMAGLVILLKALADARVRYIERKRTEYTQKRNKHLAFQSAAKEPLEQAGRNEACKAFSDQISSQVIRSDIQDDVIRATLLASHEYGLAHNDFILRDGKAELIFSAKDSDYASRLTHESLISVLDQDGTLEQYTQWLKNKNTASINPHDADSIKMALRDAKAEVDAIVIDEAAHPHEKARRLAEKGEAERNLDRIRREAIVAGAVGSREVLAETRAEIDIGNASLKAASERIRDIERKIEARAGGLVESAPVLLRKQYEHEVSALNVELQQMRDDLVQQEAQLKEKNDLLKFIQEGRYDETPASILERLQNVDTFAAAYDKDGIEKQAAFDTLDADLRALDEFAAESYKNSRDNVFGGGNRLSEQIAAAKILVRENFMNSTARFYGDKVPDRKSAFEELFKQGTDTVLETSEVAVSSTQKNDGIHSQVVTMDKTTNPNWYDKVISREAARAGFTPKQGVSLPDMAQGIADIINGNENTQRAKAVTGGGFLPAIKTIAASSGIVISPNSVRDTTTLSSMRNNRLSSYYDKIRPIAGLGKVLFGERGYTSILHELDDATDSLVNAASQGDNDFTSDIADIDQSSRKPGQSVKGGMHV